MLENKPMSEDSAIYEQNHFVKSFNSIEENIGEEPSSDAISFDEPEINKGERYITIINNNKTVNMYGDNPNLINADSIENSNIQTREFEQHQSNVKKVINIIDEDSFEMYVDKFKNTKVFLALVAISSLEMIEETQFELICKKLKEHLDSVIGPIEEEQTISSAFESRKTLYDNAFLVKTVTKRNTHAGFIYTKCLSFSDETMAEKIRNWMWELYPQFRNAIIDWLIDLSNIDKWFICVTAQNAIAEYSKIDFEFTLQTIFPKLYKKTNGAKIATLSFAIEKLYEKGLYEKNIEKLLLGWLGTINNDLWMVGFRLYAKGYIKNCDDKICDVIYKHIFDSNFRKDTDFLYIMGFAHRSKKISHLLIKVISECFSKQRMKLDKDEIAKVFIWIVLYDYFTTDETYSLLVFVDYANEADSRKLLRPILHHILSNYQLRRRLFEILNAFIIEYDEKGGQYNLIEKYIRELAFTGKKEDYDKALLWLNKNIKTEKMSHFSKYMIDYLNEFLCKR